MVVRVCVFLIFSSLCWLSSAKQIPPNTGVVVSSKAEMVVNSSLARDFNICSVNYMSYSKAWSACKDTYNACPPSHPGRPKSISVCQVGESIVNTYVSVFGGKKVPCSVAREVQALSNTAADHLEAVKSALEKLCAGDIRHLLKLAFQQRKSDSDSDRDTVSSK